MEVTWLIFEFLNLRTKMKGAFNGLQSWYGSLFLHTKSCNLFANNWAFFYGVASTKNETSMIYVGLTLLSFNPFLFTVKFVLDTAWNKRHFDNYSAYSVLSILSYSYAHILFLHRNDLHWEPQLVLITVKWKVRFQKLKFVDFISNSLFLFVCPLYWVPGFRWLRI